MFNLRYFVCVTADIWWHRISGETEGERETVRDIGRYIKTKENMSEENRVQMKTQFAFLLEVKAF